MALSEEQLFFLIVRVRHLNDTNACREIGLSRKELASWKRNSEEFRVAYDSVLRNIIQLTKKILEQRTVMAADTLVQLLRSKNENVRLKAASQILSIAGLGETRSYQIYDWRERAKEVGLNDSEIAAAFEELVNAAAGIAAGGGSEFEE